MKKLFCVLYLALFSGSEVFADSRVVGQIGFFSIFSDKTQHPNVGLITFGIKDQTLDAPCTSLWITKANDKDIFSMLISAHAQQKNVVVHYRPNWSSPGGPQACGVVTFQIFE